MNMKRVLLFFLLLFSSALLKAQLAEPSSFTRKDTLRGMLKPPRTCYDVRYYHLDVKIDPENRSIDGSNDIVFEVLEDTRMIQIDLFENMDINRIGLDGKKRIKFDREFNAVFLEFPEQLEKGTFHNLSIEYSGKPEVAKNPPWEGGLVWEKDVDGNPWVAVTVQGTGASLWWPNKDHQSDEPDSMLISISVPEELENISNGQLRGVEEQKNGWKKFHWFVSYPINNYNVTINIGKYAHFGEVYVYEGDTLALDYYVMPADLDKAKRQFEQVKPMIDFFYRHFGPYPFVKDGFKLVQSPHLGMEHQSAVAYGNGYLNGYKGTGSSEVALAFDFIILHEAAHEWWGNSITSNDVADMWVHESFGAYSEALFVEDMYGYEASMKYINGKKQNVRNELPIVGPFHVNQPGSSDMYDKGQLALNTLRHVIDDRDLWFSILKELNKEFKYQTIDGKQLMDYISARVGTDLSYFFNQYFRHTSLPKLLVNIVKKGGLVNASYKWEADVKGFRMPVKAMLTPGSYEFIYPTAQWQTIELSGVHPDEFSIAEDQFYIDLLVRKTYVDPRK
jgi:aminopeptidase N